MGRKEMKRVLASLSLLLFCTGVLFAQQRPLSRGIPPGEFPPKQLKDYLGLTDDQILALKKLQLEFREAARQSHEQMAKLVGQLRQALKEDPIDSGLVSQLRADIEIQQNNIKELRTDYRISAQDKILTEGQAKLLATLQQALQLVPAAQQAAGLNLIEGPEGMTNPIGGRQLPSPLGIGPVRGPGEGAFPEQ